MAEFARDASSSDGLCATLETYLYSSDAGENEVQDEPMGEQPASKQCATCKAYRPMAEFHQDASKSDGKNNSCKVCHRAWNNRRKERKEVEDDAEGGETAAQDEEPPRKRSRGDDLYVFKNSRLPEYKIGRSSDIAARSDALQKSQNFYIQTVAIFEGEAP